MESLFQSTTAAHSSTSLANREKAHNLDLEFIDTHISGAKEHDEWRKPSYAGQEESGFETPVRNVPYDGLKPR